jgi:hypothetical protein
MAQREWSGLIQSLAAWARLSVKMMTEPGGQ